MPVTKSYKGVVFNGATFPDDPYRIIPVKPNLVMTSEYLPALPQIGKGLRILLIAMTIQEGFRQGTRSYKMNNPGNIGNTDSGKNKAFPTLTDGIRAQAQYLQDVAFGRKKAYPLNKPVYLPPFFSSEIAKNQKTYQLGDGNVPGYKFTYTGQLDQFVKIYSTGARLTNQYINLIISYFKINGITITPDTTLQTIIGIK